MDETTKRGPGRPRKAPGDTGIQVNMYLTPDILARVDKAARESGDSRNAWIRAAVMARLNAGEQERR